MNSKTFSAIIIAVLLLISLPIARAAANAGSSAFSSPSSVIETASANDATAATKENAEAAANAADKKAAEAERSEELNKPIYLESTNKAYDNLTDAVNEAKPNEVIHFRTGEYQFTEQITLIKPLKFAGAEGSGTKLCGYGIPYDDYHYEAGAFYIDCECGDFEFDNLAFENFGLYHEDGSITAQNNIFGEGIALSDIGTDVNLTVKNCSFSKFGGKTALSVRNGKNITIENCAFDAKETSATSVNLLELAGGSRIKIADCTFANVAIKDWIYASSAVTGFCEYMDGSDVTISGCTFSNCEDSAIRFEGFQGKGDINYKIDGNNKFENCGKAITLATQEDKLPEVDCITVDASVRGLIPVSYKCVSEEGFDMQRVYYIDSDDIESMGAFCDKEGKPFVFSRQVLVSKGTPAEASAAEAVETEVTIVGITDPAEASASVATTADSATASDATTPDSATASDADEPELVTMETSRSVIFVWNPEFNVWIEQ